MSNSKKNIDTPDVTVESTEEVLEGEIVDDAPKLGPVKNFISKYKTWLIATGAGVGGFVLHALLSEPYECDLAEIEFESEEEAIEPSDAE